MGNRLSPARTAHKEELLYLLNQADHSVQSETISQMLEKISTRCPWYPEAGSLKLTDWEKIGICLHEEPRAPIEILHAWRLCRNAIFQFGKPDDLEPPLKEVLAADAEIRNNPTALQASPAPSSPSKASSKKLLRKKLPKGCLEECLNSALQEGDASTLSIYPIIRKRGQATYESLPYSILKEFRQAITEYGTSNHYVIGMIDNIATSYELTTNDWKVLVKMVTTPAQYTVWRQEFDDRCHQTANDNVIRNPEVTAEMLSGTGDYSTNEQQSHLPPEVFRQIATIATRAWRKIPDSSGGCLSFVKVCQGPQEAYDLFIDRLQRSLYRQVENADAAQVLLKQLAFENANVNCQEVLKGIYAKPTTSLADMIKACQIVGTESHKQGLLAAVLRPSNTKCFHCGKKGHLVKNCREKQRKPPSKCERCGKGFHRADQCYSLTDVSGNPIPGPPPAQDPRRHRSYPSPAQ